MGIPHLVQFLQAYATRVEYSEKPSARRDTKLNEADINHATLVRTISSVKRTLCIDGPALAYYAYGSALARHVDASNALEAMPTYAEVASIAVELLETLERYGFDIVAIFFDGLLPASKKQVRIGRLTADLKQVETFRARYAAGFDIGKAISRVVPLKPLSSFSLVRVPARLKDLPASPFLVPAVIESLCGSRFSQVTHVVSAEADSYCASHAKEHGGIIMTSDSDLLVYEMGSDASVVLFKDIEYTESKSLLLAKYDTADIASRLSLTNLQTLAYAVQKDRYRGFNGCLKHARQLQSNASIELLNFAVQYRIPQMETTRISNASETVLRQLDPRISEWVHQAIIQELDINWIMEQVHGEDWDDSALGITQSYDMYLPFLIDDSTRITAWNVGADVRCLAYSALRPSSGISYTTNEFCRRGNRIAKKSVEHLSLPAITEASEIWASKFSTLNQNRDWVINWRVIGLYSICQLLLDEGKRLPSRSYLHSLLIGRNYCGDWNYVHLSAQLQAALYSWRVLKQCTGILETLVVKNTGRTNCLGALNPIITHFKLLPGISQLFDETENVDDAVLGAAVDTLFRMLGIQQDEYHTVESSPKKKRKGKKDPEQPNARTNASRKFSSNMYDLLSFDDN